LRLLVNVRDNMISALKFSNCIQLIIQCDKVSCGSAIAMHYMSLMHVSLKTNWINSGQLKM